MLLTEDILRLFPQAVSEQLRIESARAGEPVEEIRCRMGKPYQLRCSCSEFLLPDLRVSAHDLDFILERASDCSYHAYEQELSSGFIHAAGGCRIGLCGTITQSGIHAISSVSVRIPHEVKGCAQPILPELMSGGFASTLILSPPGAGKTTLLRDLIRALSEQGVRVSVADERGEIAAVTRRQEQFDLGTHTDVMTGGVKAEACMMLLRAMNPQIIALDEITAPADVEAMFCAAGCGVSLLATAHAGNAQELHRRRLYRNLLREGVFHRAVEIRNVNGKRTYKVVELRCGF